ncbi:PIG-L deacetylase family protein [Bdellovibrio sp. BCCA]|uniref:PIG-L deacetylase family protein n=1 Tax=Bdellovibrio sp. BCCA TaxID=3136281 RepID=UPI0030F01F1F
MISSNQVKRVLVLAPHTDDGEFGCGGSIAKLIEEGADVYYAAFSACEQSVLKEFPPDILISEVKEATAELGIKKENLILFKYEVRTFNFRRQEILQDLVDLKKNINPDLVFMPATSDMHQDHSTIALEGLRAFKLTSILSYEVPWNNLSFNTSSFVHLEDRHVEKKINALRLYRSQAHRPYANEEFIRSLARTRGVQIATTYAETFDVVRWIIK